MHTLIKGDYSTVSPIADHDCDSSIDDGCNGGASSDIADEANYANAKDFRHQAHSFVTRGVIDRT